jgi:hypothetical protein
MSKEAAREEILAVFEQSDTNKDGSISADELKGLFKALGMKEETAAATFANVDKNNDGKLDFEEFLDWVFTEKVRLLADGEKASTKESSQAELDKAKAAAEQLNKGCLQELKALGRPPAGIEDVIQCVSVFMYGSFSFSKKKGKWPACQKLMSNSTEFMNNMKNFDPRTITQDSYDRVCAIMSANENLTPDEMKKKSLAAAGMLSWVVAMKAFAEAEGMVQTS